MNYIDRGSMQLSPYDQAHVALQLMLEVHSMRMQMQTERDKERELRRDQTAQHAADMDALITRHSEVSNERDQECADLREDKRDLQEQLQERVRNLNELLDVLKTCAAYGNSQAARYAKDHIARWL